MERKENMGTENKGGAEGGAAVGCSAWLGVVMRVEYSYLTIRTDSGWLLWSAKLDDIRTATGADMAAVSEQVTERLAEWNRDKHLWDTETPNDKVSDPATR